MLECHSSSDSIRWVIFRGAISPIFWSYKFMDQFYSVPHKRFPIPGKSITLLTYEINFAVIRAATNSKRGSVTLFKGATLDFATINLIVAFPPTSIIFM
ncbi:hypothetical protein T11_12104 [Trichinella zimbabwensis]|uniref:Uncharacterized protein n=1 Tax=Trichinella zimbabwensis TaxID=268475 RepID=A0A0V1H4T7_9BILA|nr:hypothetical protein T11_12104 [Trichinella zimbabwensis]